MPPGRGGVSLWLKVIPREGQSAHLLQGALLAGGNMSASVPKEIGEAHATKEVTRWQPWPKVQWDIDNVSWWGIWL